MDVLSNKTVVLKFFLEIIYVELSRSDGLVLSEYELRDGQVGVLRIYKH